MSWTVRFHRRIRLGRLAWINVGKSSASVSIGRPGATANLARDGVRTSLGIPGSGLSLHGVGLRPPLATLPARGAKPQRKNSAARVLLLLLALGFSLCLLALATGRVA